MPEPLAYLKGEFVPASQCVLPVYDLGIVLGAAVTDFVRTFHQQAFRVEDHVQRFYQSCKYARIQPPVSMQETIGISETLIAENSRLAPDEELGLVYYLTAGENLLYAGAAGMLGNPTPSYIQHTFPLRFQLWKKIFLEGGHCMAPSPRHWPPQCLSAKIKNRNRLHMWIGQQEIHQFDPEAMALYLDLDGNITETGGSNFVIFRKAALSRREEIIFCGESAWKS